MLDEPFAGHRPQDRDEIQDQIRNLAVETFNLGILLTDHNFRETDRSHRPLLSDP